MPDTVNRQSPEFIDEFILIEDEPIRKGEEGTAVNPRLEQIRAAVVLTKEAVRAASITALELATESAHFMGVVSRGGELINPFEHIQAPVWEEDNVPQKMLDAAYAYCEELTRREAGNFYHSFKYLPEEQRRSICAYYAFCRRADDIADGDYVDIFPGALGAKDPEAIAYRRELEELAATKPVIERTEFEDKLAQLFFFRKKLSTAYNRMSSTDPIFMALKHTVSTYGVPREYMDDLISGMEDDLYTNRYQTFEELYSYCYRVASTVGLVCIDIYGHESTAAAREFAESWGIFMQLTNIIRDVEEDAERDRIYLPLEDLERFGITEEDMMSGRRLLNHPGWKPFVKEYCSRVKTYRDKAFKLLPLLPKQSRYSPAAMMAFYSSILRRIERSGGDVFTERVKLSKAEKLTVAAGVYLRHRFFSF
ncbi:MAG TPA: phytoene/squalene synthase family protein [Candidatus Thalassarchaeaceae archaeon]|jgi:phytoene synthase|nr:phytoene/squalene synthase family protein [Candidatus Thalassarchaeaceae archaeon]HJM67971.1 phytoene/squalene synthase family protein [Candidatus Thalassarchaeaceae archaeon]